MVFRKISDIVRSDTGQELKWRHLHASKKDELIGICLVNVDQHGGQAKGAWTFEICCDISMLTEYLPGLGIFLKSVAQSIPQRADLHEPDRTLQELDEYDHLRRLLHLCENHLRRNIQGTGVTDEVKLHMRSLICLQHPHWDLSLGVIREKGGKAGNGQYFISSNVNNLINFQQKMKDLK